MQPVTFSRSVRRGAGTLGLALALAVAPQGFAADGDAVDDEALEEVVEQAAEDEAEDGEAAGADVGEASYNVEDCEPANDGDAEAVADVEAKELDPCRDMDK